MLVPTSAITTTKVHLCNLSRRLAPRTCVTPVSRRGAPRHIADLGTAGSVEVLSLPPNSTCPTDKSFLGLTASFGESCQAHGTERRTLSDKILWASVRVHCLRGGNGSPRKAQTAQWCDNMLSTGREAYGGPAKPDIPNWHPCSPRVEKSATECPLPLWCGTTGATARLRGAWRHKRAFDSTARQWACNEGALDGVLRRKKRQNGSFLGRATSPDENYRAQGMERRSSLHTRPPGLASASTSYEEAVALLARNKPHDRCYNVVDASAGIRRTRS